MGLLDDVLGNVLGTDPEQRKRPGEPRAASDSGATSPLLMAVLGLLAAKATGNGGRSGSVLGGILAGAGRLGDLLPGSRGTSSNGILASGLSGLVDSLTQAGHRDVAQSWVGGGPNRPIAPDQLGEALGPETVDQLTQQTGLERQDLLSQLSRVLPDVVDRLTPDARLPEESELDRY